MRLSILSVGTVVLALSGFAALYSCGSDTNGGITGPNGGDGGKGGDGTSGDGNPYQFTDGAGGGDSPGMKMFISGTFNATDCPGCTFPMMGGGMCSGAPAINVVYPNNDVLLPPNMNVISVMWTPFGMGFTEFEVDFENAITDMRVITKCAAQTMDTEQPPQASGGCELQLDPAWWKFISDQNRGGSSLAVTVRGTTDGKCASTSANSINITFADEDIHGAIYYWKSTVSANGTGGQVWVKSFGDTNPEVNVTGGLGASCNGCHALSRDGLRMVINSDDDDSDDEYEDVGSALIDMTTQMAIGGGIQSGNPGFGTFFPDHTEYLLSNGLAQQNPPTNTFYLFDGVAGAPQGGPMNVGAASAEPTMPDWSPDGKSVVFVIPQSGATWTNSHGSTRNDDDHIFGGSLFTMPYNGNLTFGAPALLLQSGGENNYYPGYSPDGQLIVFDRAPLVGSLTGCTGTQPMMTCPNDSFSNPAARVMIMKPTAGSPVIDLEAANGSPAASPVPVSNSWPKWSPFLQNYGADKLLWIAFSSTRDYGLRVRNHQPGMYQCYPADSYEDPGAQHGQPFQPNCQQPQLWMAAVDVSHAEVGSTDSSKPAFWLPFQDITTHNHTPQWTQTVANQDAGTMCAMQGQNCQTSPCCPGSNLVCQANGLCGVLPK